MISTKHSKNKRNILLIPPVINPLFKRNSKDFMPLGVLTIAAILQKKGNIVNIYKPKKRLIHKNDFTEVAKDILKTKPDIIGFSTWCITYPAALLVAQEIKKLAPDIPIVYGGPQASILPSETLKNFHFVDFVLAGEADNSFPQFVNEQQNENPDFSKIPGLSYRNGSGIIQQNKLNGAILNLDDLPIPAYNLVPKQKWLKLDVGRGCPFKCTYCSTNDFFSKKYRVKSVNRIINEMMTAFENQKIKSFGFAHDMFTLNKKFIHELCKKLIDIKNKKGIEFNWTCSARTDCVTEQMLIEMKDAGCRAIFFGIESGSEKIQKSIQKNLDISKAYLIADICRRIGIDMHASFILGFPDETKNDINKTLKSVLQLGMNGAFVQISELSLLPGTPIFKANKNQLKFDGEFSNFSFVLCGNEELKLIENYPKLFSSFYYLPVQTLKRQEIIFICHFINKQSNFRNTLFLLSSFINSDLGNSSLLQLLKNEHKRILSEGRDQNTVVSHWVKIINSYINKKRAELKNLFIDDIFAFEAFTALLKTLFASWQLINPQIKDFKLPDDFIIKPTLVWKIITTNYRLEKIIPSENSWTTDKPRIRKGTYKYLLVAVTETKCKRIRINSREEYLLQSITKLFFSEYVNKVSTIQNKKETLLWIKKMRRLGVVEFSKEK